jgi:hypothetical protein
MTCSRCIYRDYTAAVSTVQELDLSCRIARLKAGNMETKRKVPPFSAGVMPFKAINETNRLQTELSYLMDSDVWSYQIKYTAHVV